MFSIPVEVTAIGLDAGVVQMQVYAQVGAQVQVGAG